VVEANQCLANMETYRDRTLDSMCRAFIHYEDLVRSALLNYTKLEQELVAHVPEDISNVEEGIKKYSLGSQLIDTIRSHTDASQSNVENDSVSPPESSSSYSRFVFEPFSSNVGRKRSASDLDLTREENETQLRLYSVTDPIPFASPSRKSGGLAFFTAKITNMVTGSKDSDTEPSSRKNLAIPDKTPVLRPPGQRKKRPSSIAGPVVDGIRVNEESLAALGSGIAEPSPGRSPGFQVLKGFKDQFKDAVHLTQLGQRSPRKRTGLSRRPTFFGVDLCRQLRVTGRPVPLLVSKCVEELNERGLNTQGLYRVPAAQSKIKDLCRRFETDAEGVDLSDTPPHVLASVLKFYLRQLPQPLLTYKLYPQFVSISKKWQAAQTNRMLHRSPKIHRSQRALSQSFEATGSPLTQQSIEEKKAAMPRSTSQGIFQHHAIHFDSPEREDKAKEEETDPLVAELRGIVDQLSKPHYATAAALIDHLKKVAANEMVNQMNASNLAIVFGPNILRPRENEASLSTLTDMQHQLKAVEMLILHSEVFDTKQYADDADTKGYTEDIHADDSSDDDQLIIKPRLRRHSTADILSSPPPNPGTPPLRKRQSMTELEDLFSAVADANKQRLNAQRTQFAFEVETEGDVSETSKEEQQRAKYADEFKALQTKLFGRTSSSSPDTYQVISPETDQQPKDLESSDTYLPLPGVVDDDQDGTIKRLSPPTRLSPLSHSLVEHFNVNIRMATSPSSSLMNQVMREAAKAAQSITASGKLSQCSFALGNESSPEEKRRVKSQSPISSPVIRAPARRSESDIVRLAVNITDNQSARRLQSSDDDDDDDEESSVLELLITGSPQSKSGQNRCFVSAATVARRMHTTTLEEDIKRGASDHTHTCTATITPSESKGLGQSSSLASLREDISGLMQRFDEEISVLGTPPGSPAFIRRRHRAQIKKKKAKSSDDLVPNTVEEKPIDSAVQSLDSLLSTSEELLASPLATEPESLQSKSSSLPRPIIKVSSEEEQDCLVQVKTDWRADESADSVVTTVDSSHPIRSELNSDVTMSSTLDSNRDRDRDRDRGRDTRQRHRDRQTDRQADGQTDRQTDIKKNLQSFPIN
jgi:hypothetical protein